MIRWYCQSEPSSGKNDVLREKLWHPVWQSQYLSSFALPRIACEKMGVAGFTRWRLYWSNNSYSSTPRGQRPHVLHAIAGSWQSWYQANSNKTISGEEGNKGSTIVSSPQFVALKHTHIYIYDMQISTCFFLTLAMKIIATFNARKYIYCNNLTSSKWLI